MTYEIKSMLLKDGTIGYYARNEKEQYMTKVYHRKENLIEDIKNKTATWFIVY